nr:protein LURP-one-related 15 [Tanacetum cinerariifolium]
MKEIFATTKSKAVGLTDHAPFMLVRAPESLRRGKDVVTYKYSSDTLGDFDQLKIQMHKKYTVHNVAIGKDDTFDVTVNPNADHSFIVTLIVILHEINEEKDAAISNKLHTSTNVKSGHHHRYPVDLTITRKVVSLSLGKFSVNDVNGNVVFKVKPKKISLHDRRSLLDAADNLILSF